MFQVFHPDVAYVDMALPTCFKRMFRVLRMFHTYVVKVDLDVAYVATTIHACFKCFICFRHMLQIFYLDVSKVDWGVAHRGRWLSSLLGRSRGSAHMGFPCGARGGRRSVGLATDAGAGTGAGCRRRA
jgi:hypothetical protein